MGHYEFGIKIWKTQNKQIKTVSLLDTFHNIINIELISAFTKVKHLSKKPSKTPRKFLA